METNYIKTYSGELCREMECKVYGHAGKPFLFIPCQDGRFFDFENFKMADVLAPWIESGRIMVLSIDTIDLESWSNKEMPPFDRIRRYEAWIKYIVNEAAPMLQTIARERNGNDCDTGVTVFGCSLGATHAANLFLRFPYLFTGMLALSGIYSSDYGFGDYMDEVVYENSPVHYIANLPSDHPYVEQYNKNRGIICVGTGDWEIPDTTFALKNMFESKGIGIWVDIWGSDVAHDWDWWYKQVEYFIPHLID